jgi:hypothetical protein
VVNLEVTAVDEVVTVAAAGEGPIVVAEEVSIVAAVAGEVLIVAVDVAASIVVVDVVALIAADEVAIVVEVEGLIVVDEDVEVEVGVVVVPSISECSSLVSLHQPLGCSPLSRTLLHSVF